MQRDKIEKQHKKETIHTLNHACFNMFFHFNVHPSHAVVYLATFSGNFEGAFQGVFKAIRVVSGGHFGGV